MALGFNALSGGALASQDGGLLGLVIPLNGIGASGAVGSVYSPNGPIIHLTALSGTTALGAIAPHGGVPQPMPLTATPAYGKVAALGATEANPVSITQWRLSGGRPLQFSYAPFTLPADWSVGTPVQIEGTTNAQFNGAWLTIVQLTGTDANFAGTVQNWRFPYSVSGGNAARNIVALSHALTGVAASGATGALSTSRTRALTGASIAGATGTLKPTQKLTGTYSASATGNVATYRAFTLTGIGATGAVGTVRETEPLKLVGNAASGTVGLVKVASTHAITGDQATGQVGTITIPSVSHLTGTSANTGTGTIAEHATISLAGAASAAHLGTFGIYAGNLLSGAQIIGAVGHVTPMRYVAITGNHLTGAVGSLFIQASRRRRLTIIIGG